MPGFGGRQPRRDHRSDWRAVDQHARRNDQILVNRPLAVVKAGLVFAEQDEIVLPGDFHDHRAAERPLGVAGALARAPVIPERGRQARGEEEQRHGDDGGDDVTYHLSVTLGSQPLDRAYAACEALARSHYENFPVASRLLPAAMRPHVAAVYAFARVADDMADEGELPPAERLVRLAAWERRLHEALDGDQTGRVASDALIDDLIIVAAAHTIRQLELPRPLFDDLISAFGQDTMTTRYDSWSALFDYCRRSANPVGRLVLRIAGLRDDRLDRSSDAFCTALQLTNFWQDLGRDWSAGRLYVPREVYAAFGASEAQLRAGDIGRLWIRAMEECVRVTRDLFQQGRGVCDGVVGRLRYELRFTWLGGRRVLDRVEARGTRMLIERPTLGAADVPGLLTRALRWSAQY